MFLPFYVCPKSTTCLLQWSIPVPLFSFVKNWFILQELSKESHNFELPPMLVPSADELLQLDQAREAADEVTSTVLSQRLELEEKKRSVSMLQKALVSC